MSSFNPHYFSWFYLFTCIHISTSYIDITVIHVRTQCLILRSMYILYLFMHAWNIWCNIWTIFVWEHCACHFSQFESKY